ncbi:MAG: putative signal transducing protein [Aurantibacter sp.]
MESNYSRIFSGSAIEAQKIVDALHQAGVEAIVKNEAESGRLAGFAPTTFGHVELYVHNDELERAQDVIKAFSE